MSAAKKQPIRMNNARESTVRVLDSRARSNPAQWEFVGESGNERRTSTIIRQWERDTRPTWRKVIDTAWEKSRRSTRTIALVAFAFTLGFSVSSGPQSALTNLQLREKINAARNALTAREGELELSRLELARLNDVMDASRRYRIPADLATKIYDIARAEGIPPRVAFSLVDVESDFTHKAISPKGALGLTQLMPATARFFDPTIQRADLFDPETNLRIGFRYLKELIARYDGDVERALLAYNRGPTTVDRVVEQSGNPSNGYEDAVLRGAGAQ